MNGYVISISDNRLRISLLNDEEVYDTEITKDAVDGNIITNTELVAETLGELILTAYGEKPKKLPFHFVVEPDETIVGFITNSKDETSEKYFNEACAKQLAKYALILDDVYYSYKKIAPFVYQFIAIKKDTLEKYMEVANELGFELESVVPWVMLLPKSVSNAGEPKIFLTNEGDTNVLALSELNGVYHIGNLDEEGAKLKKMVHELSVYERNNPIKKVYTFGFDKFEMGDEFEVDALDVGGTHDLFSETLDENLLTSQVNLLNLLPLPTKTKPKVPSAYAGVAAVVLLLAVGGYFGYQTLSNQPMPDENDVLSESKESTTSEVIEEQAQEEIEEAEDQTEEPALEINKEYLSIRVENGTLVSGLAGRTRDYLSQFGYDVVSIGDADTSEQESAKVSFTEDYAIYADALKEDLEGMYETVEYETDLQPDLGYDALIIVGSKLVQ